MNQDAITQLLQVPIFGAIVIVLGLVVRYLFTKFLESIKEKETIYRETLELIKNNDATLKKAIEIFEARHDK